MKLENGKLVMERKDCHWCDQGKRPGKAKCGTCDGTGKGKRGKVRGCRTCYGNKTVPDFNNTVACDLCGGSWQGSQEETLYDYLPESVWQGLAFKVYRNAVPMTFNEQYVGVGCVFSSTDYGDAWKGTDEAVIAEVKEHTSHQACKVAREDGTLCNHVGIFVMPGGYAVRAVWE